MVILDKAFVIAWGTPEDIIACLSTVITASCAVQHLQQLLVKLTGPKAAAAA